MQLISYTSQTFANVQAVYNYLAANVPWWDSTANNKLTKDNITVEISSSTTTALLFTDTQGGQTIVSAAFTSSTTPITIAITDESIIIGHKSGSLTLYEGIVIAKSTDDTNNHWGVVTKLASGSNDTPKILTYGAAASDGNDIGSIQESTYNVQLVPIYAALTRYKINNAYIIIISPNPTYNGKFEMNEKKYIQGGGLALEYTEAS